MARNSLYLIDGHAHIFRAYYAPFRPLTAPSGEPTKATFVFSQMLLGLLRTRKPDYLAMVLDVSDETVFRVAIDPTYKAHREPPPEDFTPQKERIVQIVRAFGIPILSVPGFEADDIIATLCRRFAGESLEVFIVSKDKDLEQLLRDGVYLYDPANDEVIDAAAMQAAKGYPPAKAVEAQMLIGDSVDNVRGVDGVGPKKAAELLARFGNVAAIIANAHQLTPKLRESVLGFAPRADLVRQLVTLRDDVPVDLPLELAETRRLRGAEVRSIFRELGFNRLPEQLDATFRELGILEVPAAAGESPPSPDAAAARGATPSPGRPNVAIPDTRAPAGADASAPLFAPPTATAAAGSNESDERFARGDYRLIDTPAKLAELASQLAGVREFALDTETTALNPAEAELVGMSLAWEEGRAAYIAVRGVGETVPLDLVKRQLGPFLADPAVRKCGQNLKYDLAVLWNAGLEVRGVWFDTMVASFVLDSSRRSHGIDALALELLGLRKIATSELIGKGKEQVRFDELDTRRVAVYACEDADVAWRLRSRFEPDLARAGLEKLFYELEMPLVEVLAHMELRGVALDTDLLARLGEEMSRRIEELAHQVHDAAGHPFNIDSTKQLAEVLFDELKLPVVRRTKTGRSTDAEVLEELAAASGHPVPRLVLEYRQLAKLKGTYVDALPQMVCRRTGRVHCSFHQTGAVTGRLSSSDPNLQNIPIRSDAGAHVRRAFVPRPPPAAERPEDWVLLSADYSQIELRVLAHFCGDENLRRAFLEDRDIHTFVAAQIFNVPIEQVDKEQRARAKTVNFGIVYGQTAFGLARQTGMSQSEARRFIEAYFARYPRIQEFLDHCVDHARTHGYVETLLGRRRRIADIHSRNTAARQAAERFAVNTVVQGTAADIIKRAMINIHRRIEREHRPSRLLIQVHDELVFETPRAALGDEARMIRHEMCAAIPLSVPIKVDIAAGPNWLDVEELKE